MEEAKIDTKICSRCKQVQPLTEFYRSSKRKSGLLSHCKGCCREIEARRIRPPEIRNAQRRALYRTRKNRHTWLKYKYGITLQQYEAMYAEQDGVCAICGKPETQRNHYGFIDCLSVDHDHVTGQVRGLLCSRCNHGIGMVKDDFRWMLQAADYLQKAVKRRKLTQLELFR